MSAAKKATIMTKMDGNICTVCCHGIDGSPKLCPHCGSEMVYEEDDPEEAHRLWEAYYEEQKK